jgi:hypothetical protein
VNLGSVRPPSARNLLSSADEAPLIWVAAPKAPSRGEDVPKQAHKVT